MDSKTVFIQASLIKTADHNYVLSRQAFLHGMALDGLWLAAQAVEKYLKASLLLNGKDTRFYAHDLTELWRAHGKITKGIMPEGFVEPRRIQKDPVSGWTSQTLFQFVDYLDRFGSPDNRYQLVGYLYDSLVLMKVDQLVFFVRRTCRDLSKNEEALANARAWRISDHLPLERCIDNESHELRPLLLEANPFWVSVITGQAAASRHVQKVVFQPGSLQLAIAAARRQDPGGAKPAVVELLRWLLRNVRLSRANQSKVRRALRRLTSYGHEGANEVIESEDKKSAPG